MEREIDGAERIKIERYRQKSDEGYTEEHDKQHSSTVLLAGALSYLFAALGKDVDEDQGRSIWPWGEEEFKPSTQLRDMEKAGALIAAAIDRHIQAVREKN